MFSDRSKSKGHSQLPRRGAKQLSATDLRELVEEAARRVESRQRREQSSTVARRRMIRDLDKS